MSTQHVLIGLGANVAGTWGEPVDTVSRALEALRSESSETFVASPLYATAPVGPANQPDYVNAVCILGTPLAPAGLLSSLKQIERGAGRGKGRRWGPRSLDLDILDYKGRVHHWPGEHFTGPRRRMVLPHPEMHKRAFVLRPLADIEPDWRHPVLGTTASALLQKVKRDADAMRLLETK